MRPASTNTPLARPVSFCVTSALASAISSRTSSDAFSLTSWMAWPSSDVSWSVMGLSVEDALQDAGDHERAGEGQAHLDLGALEGAVGGGHPVVVLATGRVGAAGRGRRRGRRV